MNKEEEIHKTLKRRSFNIFHLGQNIGYCREKNPEKKVVKEEEEPPGKKEKERFAMTWHELFRVAENKVRIVMLISSLRLEMEQEQA